MTKKYLSVLFNHTLMCLSGTLVLLALTLSCQSVKTSGNNDAGNTLFQNDVSLIQGRLENGFTYILKENREPKDRVSMHLLINAGSVDETSDQRGLAHFIEHMMFNGTRHFPPGELVKYFQSIGMDFGGDANAHTGFYETVYDVVLPIGDEKNIGEGLKVFRDYADGALLLEDEVKKESLVILAEKRDRDSADYRTFEESLKFELPDMRLTQRLPIGTESVISRADSKALKDYYDTWYRPDNMVLVMVGEFDTKLAQTRISQAFSSFKPAKDASITRPEPGVIRHDGVKPFYHYEKESGKTSVGLEVLTRVPFREETLKMRQEQVIETLANSMIQNRLDALTRKSDSPVTSASISSGVFLRYVKYGSITADTSPENWDRALAFIEQNLRKALTYGFDNQELKRVKQEFTAQLEQSVKAAATRDSNRISQEIMMALTMGKVILSPADELALFGPFIQNISIEDVNKAIRTVWDQNHRLLIVTGNADLTSLPKKPEEAIVSVYEASSAVEVQPRIKAAAVAFPYLKEPQKAGTVVSRRHEEDLDITVVEFENGVRLNLKKTGFDANKILFTLIFGGGTSVEPEDHPGLSSLAMDLINESGFHTLDREQLDRALAGKNTRMMFSVAEDSFNLSGSSVPAETTLMFQLIRTQILDPGFHKEAYDLTMERMKQRYEEMETTVDGKNEMEGDAFLAGHDLRFGFPPFNVYRQNTIDDVKDWVGKAMATSQLELSVVGDFDVDKVVEDAALYLGSLPKGRIPCRPVQKGGGPWPHVPEKETLTLTVKTKIPKALVKVAYPTDDFWDIARTRRLSVLGSVYSEKLRNRIREELGAAYSPYAYNQASVAFSGYGVFQVVVTVDPDQASLVTEKIKIISDRLAEKGITQDELKRALDPILTSIKDLRRNNSYWLNSVLSGSSRNPVRLDWARTMESDYASITTEDILTMAERYLDNDKAAVLVIRPET